MPGGMAGEGQRVVLLGATGTIGRATARALVAAGYDVLCPVRGDGAGLPVGVQVVRADVTDRAALAPLMAGAEAAISCLASRTGVPADAFAIDRDATVGAIGAASAAGVGRFVLLSAICVQKPRLAFQRAKLAAEAALMASGLGWSVVRPTAYFKSLSGQVPRVRDGRPFLVFGDGRLTACKPISDDDLGRVLVACLSDTALQGRIVPVGGPGPAIGPLDQAAMLSDLLGREVPVRRVPVALLAAIAGGLSAAGLVSARARDRAELARIGRYYATESMLVWDGGRYDADTTPEFGTERLRDHYARMLAGEVADDRGAHAVF